MLAHALPDTLGRTAGNMASIESRGRRMRRSRSRWIWPVVLLIVMLEATTPQRDSAQRRAEPLIGFRFGPPLKAGFALGIAYGDRTGGLAFAGPIVLAEAAVGGTRASAGYLFAGPFVSESRSSVLRCARGVRRHSSSRAGRWPAESFVWPSFL